MDGLNGTEDNEDFNTAQQHEGGSEDDGLDIKVVPAAKSIRPGRSRKKSGSEGPDIKVVSGNQSKRSKSNRRKHETYEEDQNIISPNTQSYHSRDFKSID